MLVLALLACGTEYGFVNTPGPDAAAAVEPLRAADVLPPRTPAEPVWVDEPAAGGASSVRVIPVGSRVQGQPDREDSFRVGADEPVPTDVLFVVDGSSSMRTIVSSVRDGMTALTGQGVFPKGTRVAVTGTTPQAAMAAGQPHEAVHKRATAKMDPAFAGLVDAERIRHYRLLTESDRLQGFADMPLDGCASWFAPTDQANGVPCLISHTQIIEAPVGVEAGLTAVGQLLTAQPDLFRPGASVNIVFVSDTHDPGIGEGHPGFAELVAMRPDAAALESLASANGPLAAFRIHAIAPASACVGEAWTGTSYTDAALATGGQSLDICTAEPSDYVDLVRKLAIEGSRPTEAVLSLSAPAEGVDQVLVGGRAVGFSVGPNGRSILLDGGLPSQSTDVKVRYSASRAGQVRR